MTKAKSGRKLNMVLCNDIIVLIDDGNLYRMVSRVEVQVSLELMNSR